MVAIFSTISLGLWGALSLVEGSWATPLAAPGQAAKPNIVLILADDLGIGDISAYKNHGIPTPHIDSLGQSGVRFTDGHVSAAVCAPSRAGLQTGRAGTRHGSEFNRGEGVNLDEMNLGELLKQAGYVTAAFGKWHLGMKDGRAPLDQGFDEFFGLRSGGLYISAQHPEAVNGYGVDADADLKTGARLRPVYRGNKPVEEKEYLTEAFTREAIDFIERNKEKPFFVYLAYNAPHAPMQTTKKYYDRFPHIKNENNRIHAGMVSALDDGVGAVLAKLKALNLDKNTLVIFLSDNGCPSYLDGGCSNADYRGFKRYHTEGGHRVPFFMSWPGKIPAGRLYEKPISALDIFPTLAFVSGTQMPQDRSIDGVNLLPYVTGEKTAAPHNELFWRAGGNYAVREGNWKLIVANKTPVEEFLNVPQSEGGLLNHAPYPGVSPHGQHVMLFDLARDPGEKQNLAARQPDVVARLRRKYNEWDAANVPGNTESASGVPTVIDGEVIELAF